MKGIITLVFSLLVLGTVAQDTTRKVWLSGAARGVLYGDQYSPINDTDEITPNRLNSGHTMVDLTANIKPNANTYINATLRVRNDYGGFWGGGVTFDMRQLYVKGVVANAVRYQLGDINYKLTPYTFYNTDERVFCQPQIFDVYNQMLHYDMFYDMENTWRQQGVAADFSLVFSDIIEEMQFNAFATRQNPTDFGMTSERVFYGGNITMIQSKYFNAGVNYVNMADVTGTSADTTALRMPVLTVSGAFNLDKEDWKLGVSTELGNSRAYRINDTAWGERADYFYEFGARFDLKNTGIYVDVNYKDVGPQFRSPGAQSLRINYAGNPSFLTRYGRDQELRQIALVDFIRDASLYNYTLSTNLQTYQPRFGNAQPYGAATPNRKGFTLKAGQVDASERWELNAQYQSLSEIVGQGTDALRQYNTMRVDATVHADAFLGSYNRGINLEFAYWNENTNRTGTETFENVDFTNTSYSFGIEVETIEKLSILWGVMAIESSGFEYVAIRDARGDVVDFAEYDDNISESINALGLKYQFSENSSLQFNWQQSTWTDMNQNLPDYQFNQFALMYNLNF
jgi:hypothetical protein